MKRARLRTLWAAAALSMAVLGCQAGDWRTAPSSAAVTASTPAQAQPQALPQDPSLVDYIACAAANNPGLAAAVRRWQAATERIIQERTLPDPKLAYRAAVSAGMRTQEVTVEQMFPWFGKLDLRAAVAGEEAEAARQEVEAQKLKLFYQVKSAYYEYYYLSRSIAVVRENRDLVKYLEEIARVRYQTAAAGQPDVIRAQVELGKLNDQWRTLEDSRGAAAARLNAALNRPVGAPLPWPKAVPREEIAASNEQVLAWIREASPELKSMEHMIARERQAIELAKKEYYPDVGLGVGYMNSVQQMIGSDDHMVVGMISVTLPIWREKYAAGVREAEARHDAALKTRLERENTLAADAQMALYQFRDAARKIDLYQGTLIPKAAQSLKATEAAFRAGTANFVDLVDARKMLLEFQLMYERALVDQATRLAELEMLVGREIPRRAASLAPAAKEAPAPAPAEKKDAAVPAGKQPPRAPAKRGRAAPAKPPEIKTP